MLHLTTLVTLLLPLPAAASNTQYTTLFYDDGGVVYVGLKKEAEGKVESQVISFPFEGGARTRIPLPEEIESRDVIGLVPEKKKLFVLTQDSSLTKNNLMLHVFDGQKGSWKKLGQLSCPSFTKANLSATKMVFFCETDVVRNTKRGKSNAVVAKTLAYGKERLYRTGTWRFPEFMLRYKRVNLLLEGNAPNWNRLRLKSENGADRIFPADELYQLPAPPAGTSPVGAASPEAVEP
jgi:hypothetical protein